MRSQSLVVLLGLLATGTLVAAQDEELEGTTSIPPGADVDVDVTPISTVSSVFVTPIDTTTQVVESSSTSTSVVVATTDVDIDIDPTDAPVPVPQDPVGDEEVEEEDPDARPDEANENTASGLSVGAMHGLVGVLAVGAAVLLL